MSTNWRSTGFRKVAILGVSALAISGVGLAVSGPASAWSGSVTTGTIGLVDGTGAVITKAGTLVAGASNQALPATQLTVDNSFQAGDTIHLGLFDRTGAGATDAAHQTTFTGTPTVTVAPATAGQTATTAPTITAALGDSIRDHSGGKDEIVLTIGNNAAGAVGDGGWKITVNGETVTLGASVSPGALRLVPFAHTKGNFGADTPNGQFGGNLEATPGAPAQALTIKEYTVPAYVIPAAIGLGSPSGVNADGTVQSVGNISIFELSPTGLQPGTYTLGLSGGATFANDNSTHKVTGTLSGNASGETLDASGVTAAANTLTFKINAAPATAGNATSSTVTLSGILIQAPNTNTTLTYTLTGGSVDNYLAAPGTATANNVVGADNAAPFDTATAPVIVPPAVTASSTSVGAGNRIGGSDRYATAAQVALKNQQALGVNAPKAVILASGESYADALSAAYLSQRAGGASILLTAPDALPTATKGALDTLAAAPYNVKTLYVIGGTGAVSDNAANAALAELGTGATKTRLGGQDRYQTNKLANDFAGSLAGTTGPGTTTVAYGQAGGARKTAILATGENFADALAAAPAVRGNGTGALPLVLTPTSNLSPVAEAQLTGNGITQVIIVGGTGAVSSAVESKLASDSIAVKRIGGLDRFQTATMIADFERALATPTSAAPNGGLGFVGHGAYLANGLNFPDALAGGPLAATGQAAVLLTPATTLDNNTSTWLKANKANVNSVTALGLQGAISDAVLNAANAALL